MAKNVFESLESRVLLHAGDIDPAFNGGALQNTSFGTSGAVAGVVDALPDGSFLVGGSIFQKRHSNDSTNGQYYKAGIGIAKYKFDGTLDTTFGAGGEVSGTPRSLASLSQIVNTPDGGFLAVGINSLSGGFTILVKYTSAGKIDTTFGKNGSLVPDSFAQGNNAEIAIDSSGRLLVPGEINHNAVLRRYLANGKLDTTFGTNGDYTEYAAATSQNDEYHERIFSTVAVDSAGNIVVAGEDYLHETHTGNDDSTITISDLPIVHEVTSNGTPVGPFNSNTDAANVTSPSFARVVGALANGNIVLTGTKLVELKSDGTFNTKFGTNGAAGVIPSGQVALSPDGSMVTAFPVQSGTTHQFALRRILANGKLDKNFGTNGKLLLSSTTDYDVYFNEGVAIAPDGTAIAASQTGGMSPSGKVDTRQFQVARVFTGEGPAVQLIPRTQKTSVTTLKVSVLIRDSDGVDTSTLDSSDLKFVDSNSNFRKMRFVSATPIDGNDYIQATYRISSTNMTFPENPPAGWDSLNNGAYQVRLASAQIKDLLGNSAEAQVLGTINVKIG